MQNLPDDIKFNILVHLSLNDLNKISKIDPTTNRIIQTPYFKHEYKKLRRHEYYWYVNQLPGLIPDVKNYITQQYI